MKGLQMLNDFYELGPEAINKVISDAKRMFRENEPYTLHSTALSSEDKIAVFGDHFITTMRLVLSDSTGATITQMSDKEKEVYYAFVKLQNDDTVGMDPELLSVVTKLEQCIVNEINCITPSFINQAFNLTHEWEDYEIDTTTSTITTLTETEYSTLVVKLGTTTYVVVDDSTAETIAVYIGSVNLWTKP